ncbi:hypothetical protein D3C80_2170550 [compost metagenome]
MLKVAARRYRFRLLNGGPSLFYAFALVNPNNIKQNFTYIGNDGNLLPSPCSTSSPSPWAWPSVPT